MFVIGSDGVVRYSKVDGVARRIPPSEIIRILRGGEGPPPRSKTYIPHVGEFYSAIRRAAPPLNDLEQAAEQAMEPAEFG